MAHLVENRSSNSVWAHAENRHSCGRLVEGRMKQSRSMVIAIGAVTFSTACLRSHGTTSADSGTDSQSSVDETISPTPRNAGAAACTAPTHSRLLRPRLTAGAKPNLDAGTTIFVAPPYASVSQHTFGPSSQEMAMGCLLTSSHAKVNVDYGHWSCFGGDKYQFALDVGTVTKVSGSYRASSGIRWIDDEPPLSRIDGKILLQQLVEVVQRPQGGSRTISTSMTYAHVYYWCDDKETEPLRYTAAKADGSEPSPGYVTAFGIIQFVRKVLLALREDENARTPLEHERARQTWKSVLAR